MQALAFYFFATLTLFPAIAVVTVRNPIYSVFNLILSFFGAAGLFVLLGAEFLGMLLLVVYVGAVAVLFLFVVMMLDLPRVSIRSWFIGHGKEKILSIVRMLIYVGLFFGVFLILAGLSMLLAAGSDMYLHHGYWSAIFIGLDVILNQFVHAFDRNDWTYPFMAFACFILFTVIGRWVAQRILKQKFISVLSDFIQVVPIAWFIAALLLLEVMLVVKVWKMSPFTTQVVGKPIPAMATLPNTHALGLYLYTDYIYAFQAAGLILLVAMIGAIVLSMRHRNDVKRQDISKQVNRTRAESVELKEVTVGKGVEC